MLAGMQWLFVNDKSRKRGLSLIWQTVILFLLALATGPAWISYREYRQTLDNEYRYLESHAQFGEVEISEAVHRIDRLLQRIGDGRALMGTLPQALIRDRERKQLEQLPEIHFLISADRKGRVVTAESMDNPDDVPRVAALDVSQREYFTALRDAPARDADHVFVSSMFRTVTGRETIAISRALRDEAGNFQGILVASISPDYFLHVLARALPKADAPGLVLVDENGRIVHRLPTPPGPMPDSVAESPNYKAFKASGQHELGMLARSAIDNIERVIVYSRIGDTTLSLAVSRSTEATFAEWRRAVLLRSVTYLLIMGITIGLAIEAKTPPAFPAEPVGGRGTYPVPGIFRSVDRPPEIVPCCSIAWRRRRP